MKDDWDNYNVEVRKVRGGESSQRKINTLLTDLLEKEEEIALYKNRLKELEAAFYYNLELISERDFELSVLEKQLAAENEQLEEVSRERSQLEDLIKTVDEKNYRKVQQLETRLSLKEKEIKDLERDNLNNMNTLKGIIEDMKQREEKKLCKMSTKFEFQKNELIKNYEERMEQRENYYLIEIENLVKKLEQQACREKEKLACAEEEIKKLKYHLKDAENVFVERENYYLESMREMKQCQQPRKVNKEVQCGNSPQRTEKVVQAEPDISVADSQTSQEFPQQEHYEQKIRFLQEQNEVLKFIIKDLKKNGEGSGLPPGCECLTIRADIEHVYEKFESEISNLKKILEKELKARAEEDAAIQDLELSVTRLKDKLLSGLQEKLPQYSGDDICSYIYDREIQNEIQVTLLEQKICRQMDSLTMAAEADRQRVREKLNQLKRECFHRVETYLKSTEESTAMQGENLLQKIQIEIQKLENGIETDLRNRLANNCEIDKCCKRAVQEDSTRMYLPNFFCPEGRSHSPWKRLGEQGVPRNFINNSMVARPKWPAECALSAPTMASRFSRYLRKVKLRATRLLCRDRHMPRNWKMVQSRVPRLKVAVNTSGVNKAWKTVLLNCKTSFLDADNHFLKEYIHMCWPAPF